MQLDVTKNSVTTNPHALFQRLEEISKKRLLIEVANEGVLSAEEAASLPLAAWILGSCSNASKMWKDFCSKQLLTGNAILETVVYDDISHKIKLGPPDLTRSNHFFLLSDASTNKGKKLHNWFQKWGLKDKVKEGQELLNKPLPNKLKAYAPSKDLWLSWIGKVFMMEPWVGSKYHRGLGMVTMFYYGTSLFSDKCHNTDNSIDFFPSSPFDVTTKKEINNQRMQSIGAYAFKSPTRQLAPMLQLKTSRDRRRFEKTDGISFTIQRDIALAFRKGIKRLAQSLGKEEKCKWSDDDHDDELLMVCMGDIYGTLQKVGATAGRTYVDVILEMALKNAFPEVRFVGFKADAGPNSNEKVRKQSYDKSKTSSPEPVKQSGLRRGV